MLSFLFVLAVLSRLGASSRSRNEEQPMTGDYICDTPNQCANKNLYEEGNTNVSVKCLTAESCRFSSIDVSGVVACHGEKSCKRTDIDAGSVIKCVGQKSCFKAKLNSEQQVECTGVASCVQAIIQDDTLTSVVCSGDKACIRARISLPAAGAELMVRGFKSATKARISGVAKVNAEGDQALFKAKLDSGISGNGMTVLCKGWQGGRQAEFTCRNPNGCVLECWDNCCQDLTYTCTVEANKCQQIFHAGAHHPQLSGSLVGVPQVNNFDFVKQAASWKWWLLVIVLIGSAIGMVINGVVCCNRMQQYKQAKVLSHF